MESNIAPREWLPTVCSEVMVTVAAGGAPIIKWEGRQVNIQEAGAEQLKAIAEKFDKELTDKESGVNIRMAAIERKVNLNKLGMKVSGKEAECRMALDQAETQRDALGVIIGRSSEILELARSRLQELGGGR